ncbi:g13455 [Coccomyxa viridis]|uniref:G13455 protein n=1 Tax=Coccomyxa viridis TaxID=1274662 RepID=A0ABP1GH58_9CHLO
MDGDVRRFGKQLAVIIEPALPFVGHAATSAAAFTVGMGLSQAAGYALRISCATPVLSSALGMAGIGFSSILAGEASRRFGARLRGAQQHRSMQVLARDMALDAVLGMSLYKMMGGRFRSVMPSNLVYPGACAIESLPAPGSEYASHAAKGELRRLFARDGCHHCGTRMGRVIGDHIPPNKYVSSADSAIKQITASLGVTNNTHVPPLGKLSQKLGQVLRGKSRARIGRSVQRYFPQCVACCSKQAGAVKSGATRLVFHYYGMRPWYYAGAFVGLRQYCNPAILQQKRRG